MKNIFCFLTLLFSLCANAQITERTLPAEWKNLIDGGRFKDRFLPMPDGKSGENVWGTDSVRLRYVDNGIENPELSFWGGNILKGKDNKYHLFVCGWAENSPKGHMTWPQSTVFHTTSEHLSGPYTICDTIGKGHNPEAFILKDGRPVVYVIDGYYIADSLNGPWTYSHFTFDKRNRKIIEGLSNLTFARRSDGSYLMVCRGGGVWISENGISPYQQVSDRSVYPDVNGEFEDPVIWKDSLQYHLIVNDWLGRIAYYQRSIDGIHWITEEGEAYTPGIAAHKDGYKENWFKYERMKVFQDEYGRPIQANFAVIDTIKWEDHPNDRHSSKNICIPLNKGLRLSVLNEDTITAQTKEIKVLVKAEEGVDFKDFDMKSLRFGSSSDVNYGKGCKAVKRIASGKDLIIVFDGRNNTIRKDEFAPKLLGKTKKGDLLYGYARLPYVNYHPACLSAAYPMAYDKQLELEVKNFGLSTSEETDLTVLVNGVKLAEGQVKVLSPYESVKLSLPCINAAKIDNQALFTIVYSQHGKEIRKETIQNFD